MAVKSVSIRIEEEMLQKIGYVADFEGRSINSQILVLIRKSIEEFEKANGRIDSVIAPEQNVKPAKKG
ncbi:MAG: Arc family DNA-binding protein [Oscillospiraceae bacterium]|nr:Arc family DNA-binding protein [Oscillospiraceae bacterium]